MSQPIVFVLMPFAEEFDDLWELGIRETVISLGCICKRADSITEPGFIVTQVYDEIIRADLIIAEMTGQNPNVFYEVGWAHALNKPTILCAKSSDDLQAFDTAGYRHVLHEGKAYVMRKELNEVVPHVLETAPREPSGADLVWAWPETGFEPPNLKWDADPKRTGGRTQGDIDGGQSIENQKDGSQVLAVRDTTANWNHRPGWSILHILMESRAFSLGDEAIVSLLLRTEGEAEIELGGDGRRLDEENKRVWARGLSGSKRRRLSSRIWRPLMISAVVEATEDGQDPSEQGISVYLRFRSDSTIWVRQIRLYKRLRSNNAHERRD